MFCCFFVLFCFLFCFSEFFSISLLSTHIVRLKNYWKCSWILNSITRFLSSLPKPTKWLYTQRRLRSAWASCNCCQNQQNDLCTQPRLRSAWTSTQSDQSLRCPHEETMGTWLSLEHTAKTDQTGWMPRLIRVFAGHTGHFVGFVMRRLILCKLYLSMKLLLFSFMSEWYFYVYEVNVDHYRINWNVRWVCFSVFITRTTSRENLSLGVSDQVRLKPACSATEASESNEIANIETIDTILSR